MSIYYPQSSLEGFVNAIGNAIGTRIKLVDGIASTDGTSVYLPRITKPLSEHEFTCLCGVAVHEVAHVYYESVELQERYAQNDTLRRACMNACLDVNDETRIENVLNVAKLLYASNVKADRDNADADAFTKSDPVWACLAAGILWNRIGACRTYRAAKKAPHPHFAMMMGAYRILKRCKQRKGAKSNRLRTNAQELVLTSAADALVKLLEKLGDASGAPCNQKGKPGDKPSMGQSGAAGIVVAGMGEGASQPGTGDKLGDAKDGEQVASGSPTTQPGEPGEGEGEEKPVNVSGIIGGSIHVPAGQPCRMNVGLYASLRPVIIGAVERMARHDHADGCEDGFSSGTGIGRSIERAAIDGHCFSRRVAEGENLHACVLLDNSGSMAGSLPHVSAIAQAFADALANVAKSVELATFECSVQPRKHFRNVGEAGGTSTHLALKWARKQLDSKTGKRVAVFVTDGEPADTALTATKCAELVSRGVHVIGVAFQVAPDGIQRSMPGAQIVAANDPATLALQLIRVASAIASK